MIDYDAPDYAPTSFWLDSSDALARSRSLSLVFEPDCDPTDRRGLILAALAMRADLRSRARDSTGRDLQHLDDLALEAAGYVAAGNLRAVDRARDLREAHTELRALALARLRRTRIAAREARRRRALALRPLGELDGSGGQP